MFAFNALPTGMIIWGLPHFKIQLNLAMSNLLISNTLHVEVTIHSQEFPLYCFVFQTFLRRTWLSQNLGYTEVVFHSRNLFYASLPLLVSK